MSSVTASVVKRLDIRDHLIWAGVIGTLVIVVIVLIVMYRAKAAKVEDILNNDQGFDDLKGDKPLADQIDGDVNFQWEQVNKLIQEYDKTNVCVTGAVSAIYVTLNVIENMEDVMKQGTTVPLKTRWKTARESISGSARMKEKWDKQLVKWRERLHKISRGNLSRSEQEKSLKKLEVMLNEVDQELPKIKSIHESLKGVLPNLNRAMEMHQATLVGMKRDEKVERKEGQ